MRKKKPIAKKGKSAPRSRDSADREKGRMLEGIRAGRIEIWSEDESPAKDHKSSARSLVAEKRKRKELEENRRRMGREISVPDSGISLEADTQEILKVHTLADVFAALGHPVRLGLLTQVESLNSEGNTPSISELSESYELTRQAITTHLAILESVGLLEKTRSGRERRYAIRRKQLLSVSHSLGTIAGQWDQSLQRFKAMVESFD